MKLYIIDTYMIIFDDMGPDVILYFWSAQDNSMYQNF